MDYARDMDEAQPQYVFPFAKVTLWVTAAAVACGILAGALIQEFASLSALIPSLAMVGLVWVLSVISIILVGSAATRGASAAATALMGAIAVRLMIAMLAAVLVRLKMETSEAVLLTLASTYFAMLLVETFAMMRTIHFGSAGLKEVA